MYRKYKYRIKTEEEFINDFGENWRYRVECSFVDSMDIILGKYIEEVYYEEIDNLLKGSRRLGNFYYRDTQSSYFSCNISIGMIKKTQVIPNYKPKKFVY